MLDRVKETVGLKEREESLLGDLEDSISLTKMQRLYGFGICLGLGICLSLLVRLGPLITKLRACLLAGRL